MGEGGGGGDRRGKGEEHELITLALLASRLAQAKHVSALIFDFTLGFHLIFKPPI